MSQLGSTLQRDNIGTSLMKIGEWEKVFVNALLSLQAQMYLIIWVGMVVEKFAPCLEIL